MVNYECPRCGYTINIKTKYMNHLRRKTICNNTNSDDTLENEYLKYNITEKLSSVDFVKSSVNPGESKPQVSQLSVKKQYKCNFCTSIYFHRQSLSKHLKTCKEKKKDEEDKRNLLNLVDMLNDQLAKRDKQIEEQRYELKKRDSQIDELIKKAGMNIETQNIQQNIKILAYNQTDISHLKDKDYLKCLRHSNFCIPYLIEQIHFNPKKPENHNIYISNLKNNYVMVYDGSKWMIQDRDDSIQTLIDDKESIIEQKLEEWLENGDQYPEIMNKFNRYLEKKENDKVLNKIKTEIRLMLYNNRDIVSI
ncbi:MAG: hypothetical protein ACPGJP_03010 [Hyphomicrobiales bacterium]